MKNEKGITLVALILIIVALLILAAISVSLVVSNEAKNIEIVPSEQQTPGNVINDENEVVTDDSDVEDVEENTNTVTDEDAVEDTNTVTDENTVAEDTNTVRTEPTNEVEDVANVVE